MQIVSTIRKSPFIVGTSVVIATGLGWITGALLGKVVERLSEPGKLMTAGGILGAAGIGAVKGAPYEGAPYVGKAVVRYFTPSRRDNHNNPQEIISVIMRISIGCFFLAAMFQTNLSFK